MSQEQPGRGTAPGVTPADESVQLVAVDPRRRVLRRPVVAAALATALATTLIVVGVTGRGTTATAALDETAVASTDTGSSATTQGWQPSGGPGGMQGTSGSSGVPGSSSLPGSSGLPGSSSSGLEQTTTSAVAATADQQVGVVTIVSTLGYSGGESAGTGMVLTSDGLVLTNHHVIEDATSIEVTVESTGQAYIATVVGYDAENDVAVLQLDGASGLSTVALDDDGDLATGDTVTAIGNAEGTGDLVAAAGTVTATNEAITAGTSATDSEDLSGLVEFQADVVAGDSGGPVLDDEGEVVGITTAASTGSTVTYGCAITIEDALLIVEQIESGDESGTVSIGYPAFLGVSFGSSSSLGRPGSSSSVSGATIAGVVEGSPAASSGLAAGDTITAVDGVAVTSQDALASVLAGYAPGDGVTVTWTSGTTGATTSATVTLAQGPVG